MTEEEQRRAASDRIIVFLEHAKKQVIGHLREVYGLPADKRSQTTISGLQAAVRLLGAKQRAIYRQFLSVYGESELDRAAALLELKFDRDDGSQFTIGNWKHSKGRIDCPACFMEQLDTGIKRYIRICPHCENGFQHCSSMLWNNRTKKALSYTGLTMQQVSMYQETGSYCLQYCCESCHVEDIVKQ